MKNNYTKEVNTFLSHVREQSYIDSRDDEEWLSLLDNCEMAQTLVNSEVRDAVVFTIFLWHQPHLRDSCVELFDTIIKKSESFDMEAVS